ncbi:MAG: cation diffusion facilitator family transporter [Anaerolineae bacterium]
MKSGSSETPIAIYGAIGANFVIAIAKFIAALFTGSSAMLSEGIHSVADTGNQLLLLLGVRRGRVPPDDLHPFGHGKELYFWSLIVAIVLFGVGGGMSLYEGISHLQHPTEITNPVWNYLVLGIGLLVEGAAWIIALREILKTQAKGQTLWQAIRSSKDPAVFTVLGEDSAALVGLIVAFVGVFLGHRLDMPALDGVASIVIGVILIVVASFLAYESRDLIIGESASPTLVSGIRSVLENETRVEAVERLLTMHLGPRNVLVATEVRFDPQLSTPDIEATMDQLEQKIREKHPLVGQIFIEC